MKPIVLLIAFFCSSLMTAQNFSKEWKEIYQLEKEGNYKSLKNSVDDLYRKAIRSKNEAEKAKAVLFQMKLENVLEETNYQNKANRLQKELAGSKGIYKEVYRWYYIKTLMAAFDSKQFYWQRNSLVETTTNELPENIDLWSEQHYEQVVLEQVNLLFAQEKILKENKVSIIKELIDYDQIDNNLNQSVYEFFAINFINDYALMVNDGFYSFDQSFAQQKIIFPSKSDNLKRKMSHKSVELFQQLEKLYLSTHQNKALDKIRYLRFDKLISDKSAEGNAFQDLGKNLSTTFYKNRWHADYANKLINQANKTDNKDYYERALQAIAEVKKNKHENDQLHNILLLEQSIKQRALAISLKKEVYEGEPVKYRIDYQNIDSVHLAYYDFSNHSVLNDSVYQWIIKHQQPIDTISTALPVGLPHYETSAEILGKQFPLGKYLLVAYTNANELKKYDHRRVSSFQTTNVSLFSKNIGRETSALYVVHPKTGKPYEKTVVRIKNRSYVTDEFGKIIIPKSNDYRKESEVTVYLKSEIYKRNINIYFYGQSVYNKNMKKSAKIDLFTDRSIYRPGQEVHFKGILYLIEKEGNSALGNKSFQAILEDDNEDEIDKIILTTNKLGAFSGTFLLPKSIATGEFYIYITELDEYTDKEEEAFWEDISFPDESFSYQVEEYKRPTFEVALEEIKHNVFFDQEVTIKGKANSLAGGAIAHAKVKLEVKSSYYDYETYQSINLIDIRKELLTDEQGNFEYTFAIPSDSFGEMLKEKVTTNKVNYSVEVTDSAGEVRKDNGAFTVSNTSFGLNVYKYGTVKSNEPLVVHAKSYSHNGEFHPISGTVKIYQTLPNSNFYINRSWEEPELSMIDETEFRQLFPNETYSAEDGKTPEKTIVYESDYVTQENQDFTLNINSWKTGNYELTFETIDEKSGLPIVSSANFEIKNAEEKLATNENFTVEVHPKSNKNQLILETNSLYDNVWFFVEYFDRDATVQSKQFSIKKGTQLIKIPLVYSTENETISYNWFFVKEQQLHSNSGSYTIEQDKKEDEKWLVEWQSWNDKLNPAQQYQWKLLLKSAETNKAFQGELLASMYDASLDLFIQNAWINRAKKGETEPYIYFSNPNKPHTIQQNYLQNHNYFFSIDYYWNTWNYYGYNFNNSEYYRPYYLQIPKEIRNDKANFYQIEVRDANTGTFIANAIIYNLRNISHQLTNENGFAKIIDKKPPLIGVTALGYEEKYFELRKEFTVVYLHQDNQSSITASSYEKLRNKFKYFSQIYKYFVEIIENNVDVNVEKDFIKNVLENNKEFFSDTTYQHENIKKDDAVRKIRGVVTDADFGDPIPGAAVSVVGTNLGTETNMEGVYEISALAGDIIEVKFTGFETSRLLVKSSDVLNFVLMENKDGQPIDQFFITSYTTRANDEKVADNNIYRFVQYEMPQSTPESVTSVTLRGLGSINGEVEPLYVIDGVPMSAKTFHALNSDEIAAVEVLKDASAIAIYGNRGANGVIVITTKKAQQAAEHLEIPLRKNLQETAFFYPHLQTNKDGEVIIDFTAPEALTKWKFRGLAHNKSTDYIYIETLSRTQKDVMIQPNMPRFVRETDEVVLKARVSNTTAQPLNATAMLRLFNTITGEDLTGQIIKTEALVPVIIEGLSANTVSWTVQILKNIEGLQYRISVQSGNFTDGEESVIPVLSNRQLVTETLPIWQLANENKSYQLTNLIENESKTLENHQLKIEVSNNATWLMMQSLPYLFDYPHQCSEQLFAKYFANVIASNILENSPSIQQLVKEWKENPKSKLEENEELKQILLQETPWMKDLVSKEEQKAQFAHYFDVKRLDDEAEKIEDILTERQLPSGAFPWFSGGNENRFITEHILITAAQLKNLGINNPLLDNNEGLINKAHRYLDIQFEKKFKDKQEASFLEVIDYAFVKSYYKDSFAVSKENQTRIDGRLTELKKDWVKLSLYDKARLALISQRKGDKDWAKQIINQLEQSSVIDETYGMYWKENANKNYYYYNAAEVQALIIEAYKETEMSQDKIQRLTAWLLSQKLQTNWGSTKATTQSLYAFLLSQQDAKPEKGSIQIQVGNEKLDTGKATETEQQIGIYAYQWTGDEVKNNMGKMEVKNTTSQPVFGGIYWQYFEDMSEIKSSENGLLNISRNYYIENNDNKWDLVTADTQLTLGQKVKVRIEVEAVRNMSFVHIKDVRPATFEPVDVLSGYHYKNGLGYYQSTRDAATHFFVDTLNKGKYVLEYEVRLNNIGTFTSGISTIQSMYAPAHSGHSDGKSVKVE